MKMDVLWRRADGFDACLSAGVCDGSATSECADSCFFYEEALSFVEEKVAELETLDEMLSSHELWISSNTCKDSGSRLGTFSIVCIDDVAELGSYVSRLREHLSGTQDELNWELNRCARGMMCLVFEQEISMPERLDSRIGELRNKLKHLRF